MNRKSYVGRLISVKYADRKTPIEGYVIDDNDQWTLMRSNPVDYVIDGYIVLRHKNVEGFRAVDAFHEKIIRLKGVDRQRHARVPLTDLASILRYLTDRYGLFLLYTKSERACYVGRLHSVDERDLVIDPVNSKGRWEGPERFKPDDIRVIEFDTDYLNSLKLVSGSMPKRTSRRARL